MVPVEAVVRGYLAGSGWKEYRETGTVCGVALPPGLRESDRLPEPIFTPATKEEGGAHDVNISFDDMVDHLSAVSWLPAAAAGPVAEAIRDHALRLYRYGSAVAARAGILLADTKFEFGFVPDDTGDGSRADTLTLVDEALTPDSSRFWDAVAYEPGRAQASYDKQFVRDWLEAQRLGQAAAWPGAPRGRRRGDAGTLRRGVRADHRRELRALPRGGRHRPMSSHRFAVNVTPKPGILDPQGRAVEGSLGHLGIEGVSAVRVGRRVELTVEADDAAAARAVVERLASELLSNPLIEAYAVEELEGARV